MMLTDFLLARIAEDEGVARATIGSFMWADEDTHGVDLDPVLLEHLRTWRPDRVLAECETKRHVIAIHTPEQVSEYATCEECLDEMVTDYDSDGDGFEVPSMHRYPCPTLRSMAPPYADHPDYQQEWSHE